jgi:hypothetical protein
MVKVEIFAHGIKDITMLAHFIDLVSWHIRTFMTLRTGVGLAGHFDREGMAAMA